MFMYSLRRVALSASSSSSGGVCQQHQRLAAAWQTQTTTTAPRSSSSSSRRRFATSQVLLAAKEVTEPLKILFCGSDPFSCASLRALHQEQLENKKLVEEIEVMVMPGKRVGRGLMENAPVPCKDLAEQLGLKIHERPSFENWKLPRGVNLVVAVSFGLFVPPRILSSAKYGGLNIHPSLLPHLRGPAPIHRAVLRGDPFTGISLQTLSPKAFDHGTILAQTPAPGIPLDLNQTFAALKRDLAARGATMLVEGLRAGLHVPPHDDAGWWAATQDGGDNNKAALVHAPKTSKEDQEVDWKTWTADDLMRHMNVFHTVWTRGVLQGTGKRAGALRRILFTRAKAASPDEAAGFTREQLATVVNSSGVRYEMLVKVDGATGNCYFPLANGTWICVTVAKMEGTNGREAMSALRKIFRAPDQPF
ncbi:methionyl-tRNA transformylase [Beauveria brongniartii RCEF 3172]|uniref:methionyl-tRNA formyltransferase n=1 Tax=Beauveria brongniartii RCEF 3172 TaxID=1081107 RepID=A0A166ZIA7_9HYPO|nr:methionyl-tRNA transformylase [Beauveria brongniartii RCEF 3172]